VSTLAQLVVPRGGDTNGPFSYSLKICMDVCPYYLMLQHCL